MSGSRDGFRGFFFAFLDSWCFAKVLETVWYLHSDGVIMFLEMSFRWDKHGAQYGDHIVLLEMAVFLEIILNRCDLMLFYSYEVV